MIYACNLSATKAIISRTKGNQDLSASCKTMASKLSVDEITQTSVINNDLEYTLKGEKGSDNTGWAKNDTGPNNLYGITRNICRL